MTQLLIIAAYFLLLLGLGFVANRLFLGTSRDYMLASHSIGPFLLLMSLFGTTMTAFALVGSTGEAFKEGVGVYGMLASSSGIIHSLCFLLIGVRMWTFGRKYGYTTQIQFFRDRLASDKFGVVLFPILVGLVIPYLLIGVMAAGTVINGVTEGAFRSDWFAAYDYGVPGWLGSLSVCCVVLIYVFCGGMRGTAWANAFQTMVFMVLGLLTFFIISSQLGGLSAASMAVKEKHPGKLMREVSPQEKEAFETAMRQWEALAYYRYAQQHRGVQLSGEQQAEAHQDVPPPARAKAEARHAQQLGLLDALSPEERQLARIVQDDRLVPDGGQIMDAQGNPLPLSAFPRSDAWEEKVLTGVFKDRIGHPDDPMDASDPDGERKWTRKRALGIYRATNWAPDELHRTEPWTFFTYLLVPLSVGMFPHLFQHWLTAKSARSFKLPVVAHPLFIMIVWVPCVLVGIWATSAVVDGRALIPPHFPANAVLAKMVKELTNPVVGGLLTAGILAAIMSSLDSQFLCLGTMFTNDIVLHYGGRDRFSDKQQVILARLFIVGIVAVTYMFSLFEPRRVFTMGVWCFSGFASLFPLAVAAVYWRRFTAAGAFASVFAALGSWIYFFYQSSFGAKPRFTFDLAIAGQTYPMMPVAPIFVCSLTALIVVSLVTRPPDEKTLAKFFGHDHGDAAAGPTRGIE